MRIDMVVIGSHGDVLPFIAMGSELRRRGHDVTIATSRQFAPLVRRENLGFFALTSRAEYQAMFSDPDVWRPVAGLKLALSASMTLLRPIHDFVASRHGQAAAVTVASSLAFGARIAQERHGIRLVTVHLAPMLLSTTHDIPRMPGLPLPAWLPRGIKAFVLGWLDRHFLDPFCKHVNVVRSEFNLPPAQTIVRQWSNSPDRVIAMFSAWFAPPQPDWPTQVVQVDFPAAARFGDASTLDDAVLAFLDQGDKPIVFTFGSAMLHADDLLRTSIDIVRRLGGRGIIVAPEAPALPASLAGRIMHVRYAPFSHLLPRCAALVHHGGVGTVAAAMAAGIPQLIVPLAFDHFDEAIRVRRLGVGLSLSRAGFTAPRAVRRLRQLTSSASVRACCAAVATRLENADGIAQACDAIEQAGR